MSEETAPTLREPVSSEHAAGENFVTGAIAGSVAALVGAGIWAAITAYSGYQIGYMALGVGFLVGIVMKKAGNGRSAAFGILAAVIAVIGCVAGNLLSACSFVADEYSLSLMEVLANLSPDYALELLVGQTSPIDALFYFLAVSTAFRTSRHVETEA